MSEATRRLKLTIAYDGRPFRGWQSQAEGGAIQDFLQAALSRLCGAPIVVHGSGRTDSGVHAMAQVAHADVPAQVATKLSLERWAAALNAHLPQEIRIMRAQWAPPGFEARFSAVGKVYRYRLWNGRVMPPLEIGRAWHLIQPVNIDLLKAGAALLEGKHDFGGFAANRGTPVLDTTRTIHRIAITGRPSGAISLTFEGDGFLYRMVRLLTGTLVRAAQGKEPLEWVASFLTPPAPGKPWRKTSFGAPAEGLYLLQVRYRETPSQLTKRKISG